MVQILFKHGVIEKDTYIPKYIIKKKKVLACVMFKRLKKNTSHKFNSSFSRGLLCMDNLCVITIFAFFLNPRDQAEKKTMCLRYIFVLA